MSGKDETVLIFEPAKDWERQAVLREALRSYRDQLDEIVFNCVMDDNPDVNGVRDDALQNAMLASGLLSALSAQPTQEQAS